MVSDQSVTHKLIERLSSWRSTALFHARDGRSLRGLVVRLFESNQDRARDVLLSAMHRAITINHPVIDLALPDSDQGKLVMVSDIWPGELLEKRLEQGPLPFGHALDIARNLAAGLSALHRAELIHGGIHPANIWLAEDGAVRLLGLGLAAADERPLSQLSASEVAYMAPEILRGAKIGPASDVWSLGVVLRQCLTGKRQFRGDQTTTVIRGILGTSLEPLRGDVPEELEYFLDGALSDRPEKRLADGDAAHRALLEIPAQLTIDPTRPLEIEHEASGSVARIIGPVAEGARVQAYEVLETLGSGGMGVVHRAHDVRLDRDVALKFLPVHVKPEQREDFEREARAASSLDHPNICTIYGIDETDRGDTFIAMACYDGGSLGERLLGGALELDDALNIGAQIASGLEAAHRIGLVHRDIKPGNILFSRDGMAKIVDFGLSAIAEPGSDIIETEELYGTIGYVAPEILRHEPFDARVDIWALGVVIFEMVTGRKPFQSQEMMHFIEVLEEDPPLLRDLAPEAPKELERLIAKTLRKDPSQRTPTAGEIAGSLRRLRRDGAEPREITPSREPFAIALLLFLLLASGLLLLIWPGSASDSSSQTISFAGIHVESAPPWAGLAIEELLELELAARDRSVDRLSPSAAQEALETFDPAADGSAALWRRIGGPDRSAMAGLFKPGPSGEFELRMTLQGEQESHRGLASAATIADLPALAEELADSLFGPSPGDSPHSTGGPGAAELAAEFAADLEPGGGLANAQAALLRLDSPAAFDALESSETRTTPLGSLLMATSLYDLGREEEAREIFSKIDLVTLPRPWQIYFRARQHDFARDYPRAAALYRVLLAGENFELLPEQARFEAASALIRSGEPEKALATLESVAESPQAVLLKADAYHWQGAYGRQLQAAAEAQEIASDLLPFIAARAERLRATALWRSGDLDGGLEAARSAAEHYRRLDHVKGQADAAMAEGIVLYEKGDLVLAKDSYDRAAHLYASLGNLRAEARTLTNKALVLQQQGDLSAHLEVTERALELFRQREDHLAELITLVNLTTPLRQCGRLDEADQAFARAEELSQKADRFGDWVSATHGAHLLALGRLSEARARLEEARRGQLSSQDEVGLAASQATLADLFFQEGEIQEASKLIQEALPILAQRGTPGQYSSALRSRAEIALAQDDAEAADAALHEATALPSPRLEQVSVRLAHAHLALTAGRSDQARREALEALGEFELRRADLPKSRALKLLAEIALANGQAELALQRLQAASELSRSEAALPIPLSQSLRLLELRALIVLQDPQARPELQALLAEVVATGWLPLELEVRLAIGEAEIRDGYESAGRSRLGDLAEEASLKGYTALAKRALAKQALATRAL